MQLALNSAGFWRDRLKASGTHLLISLAVAALAGALVFGVWYPYPYREMSSGRELFLLVVTVDVILGPCITLAVFNLAKGWPVMRRDLAVIALLQLAALGYGLWTVYVARPVHLVFEFNRFSVVHAADVPTSLLAKMPPGIEAMPLTGPTLLALRTFKDSNEMADATLAAIAGAPMAARPDLWRPYADAIPDVLKAAKPTTALKMRFPHEAAHIDQVLAQVGRTAQDTVWLPVVGRKTFWTAFLDPVTAQVLTTLPLDSF